MGTGGAYAHYGNANGLTDYETKTTVAYLSGDFYPAEKWKFHVGGSYALSEAAFSPIEMTLPETIVEHADYDFSNVNGYSDLKFNQLELWAKGSREILKSAALYAGIGYFDLQDKETYIYGDQSGKATYIKGGLAAYF